MRGIPVTKQPKYGGHEAVTRSICEGFAKLEISYNLDPQYLSSVGDVVICLADPRSLIQAIGWKERGKIRKLVAGYTILGSPLDQYNLSMDSSIDYYVCASEWIRTAFDLQCPGFRDKAIVAPTGVDETFWTPGPRSGKANRVLFYKKTAPHFLYNECLAMAKSLGLDVVEIVYGSYDLAGYLAALQRSDLLVNWVDHETQGIAMAEAWAADVPTFVWNPGFVFLPSHGRNYVFECTSSPYLTGTNGRFFRDSAEFGELLGDFASKQMGFAPRKWVLENLTDSICTRRLYSAIGER